MHIELHPNHVYDAEGLAELLRVDAQEIERLMESGAIESREIGGKRLTSGHCVADYFYAWTVSVDEPEEPNDRNAHVSILR